MKMILFSLLIVPFLLDAQSVGVGTNTPNASAVLDVTSTSKGLLIPRMTGLQKENISMPATGLLIWQSDGTPGFYYNNGTPAQPQWMMLSVSADTDWKLTGNNNVDSATHFLGSVNSAPVYFKARNTFAGQLDSGKATYFGYKAGWENTDTTSSAFGLEALSAPSETTGNTAFGFHAARNNRSGDELTAVGVRALENNSSGELNTAIGARALMNNTTASQNTAVGNAALVDNVTGNVNTAIGFYALHDNTASSNTAVGRMSMRYNTTGYANTAVGNDALFNSITGLNNTAVGYYSLRNNLANEITALGFYAGWGNTIGTANTALGTRALQLNVTGSSNTAVGFQSLKDNKSAYNTAVGAQSMEKNTDGQNNTATGYYSLNKNINGNGNTAMGFQAMANTTSNNNTAFGSNALALSASVLSEDNTAFGAEAMQNAEGTARNTAIGIRALRNCISLNVTNGNTAVGYEAAIANTSGVDNTTVGTRSMYKNTTGGNSTAIGGFALSNNINGESNTALGLLALNYNTSGDYNVAVGTNAGKNNVSGDFNTFLGYNTGVNISHINATVIGYAAYAECGNCMILGSVSGKNNANVTTKVGIATTNPQYAFQVGLAGDGTQARANAWNTFSDIRYKTNIEEIPDALSKLESIHGYYYNWKTGADQTRQAGLMAQEVETVLPEIVSTDTEGYKSVEYGKMNALLIQAIKELKASVIALQQENEKIKKQLPAR